jgi:hypothetical protein
VRKGLLLSICLLLPLIVKAQVQKEGKGKKLRELSPDRPHQTESPHTVDVGHIMFETDLVNNTFYSKDIPHSSTTGLFYFNLKAGIQKNMDIEILSNAYSLTHYEHNALPPTVTRFPDLTFRYKLNVMGNDSGKTSIAIMPFMTTTNLFHEKWHAQAGGILVNAEQMIGSKYEVGFTGGLTSFSTNPFFMQHECFSTISFSYPLYKSLNHFAEISDRLNEAVKVRNNYSFDSGFTFTPTENNQFDMGFYYFIPTKMLYIFIGTTIRI